MGLLDSIFGGQSAPQTSGGGPSKLTLALLALLAYRTYQGKGRLADMMGRGQPTSVPQPPGAPAGDTINYPQYGDRPGQSGGQTGGGIGDILGGIFGRGAGPLGGAGAGPMGRAAPGGGGLGGGLGGLLGGLFGGAAAGGMLNGGLGELLNRFQQNGHGDVANSWVGRGPNRAIDPEQVEQALGRDTVQELSDHSGRPYMDVLSELSQSLPDTVDKLTPEGRLPTEDEAKQWV